MAILAKITEIECVNEKHKGGNLILRDNWKRHEIGWIS